MTVIRSDRGARRPGISRSRRASSDRASLRTSVFRGVGMLRVLGQLDRSTDRSTIAGGFVLVSVACLIHAWQTCRAAGGPGVGAFRAWLACHEMMARRCLADGGRSPLYDFAELA